MRMTIKHSVSRRFLLLLAVPLFVGQANLTQAIDNIWDGSVNDSWNVVGNWHFSGPIVPLPRVPSDSDSAVLSSPAGDDVRLYANTAPINGLLVSNGIELFTNGFLLEVDNAGLANTAIAGGTSRIRVEPRASGVAMRTDNLFLTGGSALSLDGGDALVEGNTTIFESFLTGNDGENIEFGGNVTMLGGSFRMFNRATATFSPNTTFNGEMGAFVDLDHQVNIVDGMTFDFQSGARLEPMSLNIGNNGNGVGSVGTLRLDSMGSSGPRVDVALELTIGHPTSGAGLLIAKDSFATAVGDTTIHATGTMQLDDTTFGAFGNLLVDGGTVTAINQNNPIFLDLDRTLTATNGGNISIDGDQSIRAGGLWELDAGADLSVTGQMTVGTDVSNPGTLTLAGAGTTIDIGANLIVGEEQREGHVMLSAGAVGTVGGNVEVGHDGTGTLTLESGATLSGGFARVGGLFQAVGTATVSGAGSRWTNSSFLTIGSSGIGQLNIEAGGQVECSEGFVASDGNASGTVTVVGDDSTWTIAGGLRLGGGSFGDLGGAATLKIQAGGAVEVGAALVVYSNDLLQLSGGTLTTESLDLRGGQFDWTGGTLHVEMSVDDIVNQGGTLAPGKSAAGDEIGLTTIDGDYTQQTGGVLAMEIAGASPITEYDQLSVTGIALIDGELELAMLDGFLPQPGDTFTILSALGGIAGVFDNVTTGDRLETVDGIGSFLVHYGPGSLFDDDQVVLSAFQLADADLDNDGDVDGNDFLLIQRTNPALIPLWQSQYPGTPGPAAAATVPEPTCLASLLSALSVFLGSSLRKR